MLRFLHKGTADRSRIPASQFPLTRPVPGQHLAGPAGPRARRRPEPRRSMTGFTISRGYGTVHWMDSFKGISRQYTQELPVSRVTMSQFTSLPGSGMHAAPPYTFAPRMAKTPKSFIREILKVT